MHVKFLKCGMCPVIVKAQCSVIIRGDADDFIPVRQF